MTEQSTLKVLIVDDYDMTRTLLKIILRGQQFDIHSMSTALVGDSSKMIKEKIESSIAEYMTSGDQVQKQIAQSIADKIVFDLRGSDKPRKKTSNS